MISDPPPWLTAAAMQRLMLLINHVLASEPAAVSRLQPHAGGSFSLVTRGAPSWAPRLPSLSFGITPAGMFEWLPDIAPEYTSLQLSMDASRPLDSLLQTLSGHRPAMSVQGDAALATELSWIVDHVRWDLADDLSRLVGPAAAAVLTRLATAAAAALRAVFRPLAAAVAPERRRG